MNMAMLNVTKRAGLALVAFLMLLAPAIQDAMAQDRPSQRHIRSYIPPDQLVSFLPSTPFEQFVDFINPIFVRVTGKEVIDPDSRKDAIGVSLAGLHYFDAFQLVLEYNGLSFRETDRYFIVEAGQNPNLVLDAAQATSRAGGGTTRAAELLASLDSREIQIDAVLFEVNQSKARELGINWDVVFGQSTSQSGTGSGGTGTGGTGAQQGRFQLRTERMFESLDGILLAPATLPISDVFRVLETSGVGETVANPTVTVQSAEKGRIQIGSDVPIQTRDFSGNTITQFFSTGIIVDVTPTLITQAVADTVGSPSLDFIHLDIAVEKSSSRPSLSGPVIDRNVANTKVLLLHGEQTIIGGLYSTEESRTRRGIPLLKDLPPWFFGLRYVFGYEQVSTSQKELLIVLQAHVVDPIRLRAQRPIEQNMLEQRRQEVRRNLDQFSEEVSSGVTLPGGY